MITSKQNEKIKFIRSLHVKKNRDASDLYIVEGYKSCKEAIKKNVFIDCVVCTEKGKELLNDDKVSPITVSQDVFDSITDEVSPQGIIAICRKPDIALRPPKGSCLFLDGINDPANLGSIIRTAAASGYEDIYLARPCADAFSPKSVRASMSGIFSVNVFEGEREELLNFIDCPVYVADMNGENVFNFKADAKFCIVIGNEANGVSDTLKKKADKTISIPMRKDMESLNAGVSAGILMYILKNFKGE